ncbi:MAG: redoxin family protein [Nitrososphaerota archaeon]|nr:redoxin family protein [Nitrososphaerota archaeon]MDG6903755.1 redoxin family protein [Nitrososphaerota archaeon]MDG6911612.1 redoxin family protein [Nitrososphaerota archaeon]MDG6940516.1 redoxin family protein [Nitrososphaerota archaeon]MDG6960827.1 redoxin family protein [Nitrososphaerota archaeon]
MRNRKPGRRRNGGNKKLLLVSLGVLVVLVAAGVGAYAFYDHQQPANTTGTIGIGMGDKAPDMPIYLTNGTSTSLSSFQGGAVLVWMVATWCPGCQETAPVIASQYYSQLRSAGVTLLTVEDFNDLGYSGPTMTQFASQYAGGAGSHPGWLFADTSQSATYTYNPQADLDIWYLVGPSGKIVTSGFNLGTTIQSAITAADNLQTVTASG